MPVASSVERTRVAPVFGPTPRGCTRGEGLLAGCVKLVVGTSGRPTARSGWVPESAEANAAVHAPVSRTRGMTAATFVQRFSAAARCSPMYCGLPLVASLPTDHGHGGEVTR